MYVVRKGRSYFIERTVNILFLKYRYRLTYRIKEISYDEDFSEYKERKYLYEFPTYGDAEIYLKYISKNNRRQEVQPTYSDFKR